MLASLRSRGRAGAPVAVVLDGKVLFSGTLPNTPVVCAAVMNRLRQRVPARCAHA